MLQWLRKLFGTTPRGASPRQHVRGRRRLRATYDAAQTTRENTRHWANADALSAKDANSLDVRKALRERARYEYANNSYCQGIVLTLANNMVGTGPRLQVQTADQTVNRAVERAWSVWAQATRFVDKLRTAKVAKSVDGEPFGLLTTNPALPTSVQLDVRLVECDQITTPYLDWMNPLAVDGLRFDEAGNPVEYDMLKYHPGDLSAPWTLQPIRVPARSMLHWFRQHRPGQVRGVPDLTPALPLFAQLRRFTLATITAAETAAMFAAMLESQSPPNDGADYDSEDDFSELEIARGMLTTVPAGWKMNQLKAEHPSTLYEMFVNCVVREIARCLSMPLNIALGSSKDANFSSARLDHLIYRQAVAVEREDCEREWVGPTFAEWLNEATRIPNLLPPNTPAIASSLPHCWHWPAWEPIDPKQEADAEQVRLASGTATLAEIAGQHGQDWREVIRQQEQEALYRRQVQAELGTAPTQDQGGANADAPAQAA